MYVEYAHTEPPKKKRSRLQKEKTDMSKSETTNHESEHEKKSAFGRVLRVVADTMNKEITFGKPDPEEPEPEEPSAPIESNVLFCPFNAKASKNLTRAEKAIRRFDYDVEIMEMRSRGLTVNLRGKGQRVTLDNIAVKAGMRGQGLAAHAMQKLVEYADEERVILDLYVGLNEQKISLISWFERHGFQWNGDMMERIPPGMIAKGFHITIEHFLPSILEEGLQPKIGPRAEESGANEPAVYLYATGNDVKKAMNLWFGTRISEGASAIRILEVNLMDVDAHKMPGNGEIIVHTEIPADRFIRMFDADMKLISTLTDDDGKGKSSLPK